MRLSEETWHPAKEEWLSQTEACERPITERDHSKIEWRRFGKVAVSVEFGNRAYTLYRIETLEPNSGDARRALDVLKALSDRFGGTLTGNSHAYPTDECPEPDQGRLNAFYLRCGFSLGPEPWYRINFPPNPDHTQPTASSSAS